MDGLSYGSEFTPFLTSAPFIYDHWPIPVRRMTSHYLSYRRKLFFVSDKWLLGEVLVSGTNTTIKGWLFDWEFGENWGIFASRNLGIFGDFVTLIWGFDKNLCWEPWFIVACVRAKRTTRHIKSTLKIHINCVPMQRSLVRDATLYSQPCNHVSRGGE